MDKPPDDPQTDTSVNSSANTGNPLSKARYLLSALGPGLLMAAAAIGRYADPVHPPLYRSTGADCLTI
ncbi:hypothetical protein [Shewanella benthica]|nr:hypothetical protein [Shewanella benthica]